MAKLLGGALLALLFLVAALLIANSGDAPVPDKAPGAIRIATFNVHYIDLRAEAGRWSRDGWEARKGAVSAALRDTDADIVAFQEMESFRGGDDGAVNLARDHLLEAFPGYAAAASGDWRRFPSTQPIFYRTDRFRLLDEGWFFFSDTPDVIYSRTFDGSWPAFASWAEFAPLDGGRAFRVVNVHFEYRSGSNRLLSAALVRDRVAPVVDDGTPVFLVGDLNASRRSRTARILAEAGILFAPVRGSTYHFDRGVNLLFPIDHIGATPDLRLVTGPVVLRRRYGGVRPSDHYPVLADYLPPG